jgi:hypothetical protein
LSSKYKVKANKRATEGEDAVGSATRPRSDSTDSVRKKKRDRSNSTDLARKEKRERSDSHFNPLHYIKKRLHCFNTVLLLSNECPGFKEEGANCLISYVEGLVILDETVDPERL